MTSAPLLDRRHRTLETEAAACVGGLFERHGRMVYGVCRAMLRNVHDAEDAAQQVFLSAHKALLGRADVRDSAAWLATIARNECRARIAAGMRVPLSVADENLEAIPSSVDEQARYAHVRELSEALAALPERQRDAVVLRYLYGLRYGEVASALGLSRPATEALLFRARRALRVRLRPAMGTVLVVPLALREELALAIPGFSAGTGTGAVAAGAAGGVLAKLTAGSVGVKVATAAVAVSTVGAVGTVESDRPVRNGSARTPIVETSDPEPTDIAASRGVPGRGATSDESRNDEDRSGPRGRDDASDDSGTDNSGPGSGSESGDPSSGSRRERSGTPGGEEVDRTGSGGDDSVDEVEPDDSSGSRSGRSSDEEDPSESSGSTESSGSSGSSDSSGSSGNSGGIGSRSGSGSGDAPDDEEP